MNRQSAKGAKIRQAPFGEPAEGLDRLANGVIGAAIEVHRILGPGFLEGVYEEALALELTNRGIRYDRQVAIAIAYKGHPIGRGRLDLLVGGLLLVELKAIEELAAIHTSQVLSYLKATGLSLALLINFNVPLLRGGIRRIIHSH